MANRFCLKDDFGKESGDFGEIKDAYRAALTILKESESDIIRIVSKQDGSVWAKVVKAAAIVAS